MNLSADILKDLAEGIHDASPVAGLTHNFYKYPARFTPKFARSAINAFSKPGDVVFDPFMGGGTTLVEANALGRIAIGTDVSELASFISRVKTTVLNNRELQRIVNWANNLNLTTKISRYSEYRIILLRDIKIGSREAWPIRNIIINIMDQIEELPNARSRDFARCALLRTAQWAFDCKLYIPNAREFRDHYISFIGKMVSGIIEYRLRLDKCGISDSPKSHKSIVINRSIVGINAEKKIKQYPPPALILTSPPYPGVHILYSKWQIQSRRESSLPFYIINSMDGKGESFYTFGSRSEIGLKQYFSIAYSSFKSIANISDNNTILVQMISFSNPSWQLQQYLDVLYRSGFEEILFPSVSNSNDGRIWRSVPNRKWYIAPVESTSTKREVVLIHKLHK